ncbi:signal peptide-containing protein [Cryptosporidium canis]|nr:signal peptide-containing protein [Cryptosporidium canis]
MKRELLWMFFATIHLSLFIQDVLSLIYIYQDEFHVENNLDINSSSASFLFSEEVGGSEYQFGDGGTAFDKETSIDKTNNIRSEKKVDEGQRDQNQLSRFMVEDHISEKSKEDDVYIKYRRVCSSIRRQSIGERRYWTHLVFIHADNNLESMSLVDLGEMTSPLQTSTADHLHLVVYIDRSKDFTNREVSAPIISCVESGLTNPEIRQENVSQNFTGAYILYRWRLSRELRVLLRKRFVWIILEDLGEVDSNSPEVLSSFISEGLNRFPSVYSALTLWNHGSAWSGFGDDHDNSDGNGMSLHEMYRGIKEGIVKSRVGGGNGESFHFEFKFDILGFDACLMMQFDVLEVMNSLASYILASEDNEPGHGWNFRSLNPVTVRGSTEDEVQIFESRDSKQYRIATPLEYASRIVYGYTLHPQSYPLTLSLINTDLYRVFRFNLYNLFSILYKCGGDQISNVLRKTILNSKKIENCDMSNLCSCYDMGDMLELLRSYLSQEFSLDHSIQELLALTLDSYYNMQIASVNIQECRDPDSELYGRCEGDLPDLSFSEKRNALNFVDEQKSHLETRLTGVSMYFPDPGQQVLCRDEFTASNLAKRYVQQTNNRWVQIISDILTNKPGQICNLELKFNEDNDREKYGTEQDYQSYDSEMKVNNTLLSISFGEGGLSDEIILTSRVSSQVISSQTLITYPISIGIGDMVPISLILPTRIKSKGKVDIVYRNVGYEVYQGRSKDQQTRQLISNLTLVADSEKEHFTGHFMYYQREEDIVGGVGGASIAYLIFDRAFGGTRLMVSSPEGMSEKSKDEGGFLVPIIYYLKVDSRRNRYLDEIYQSICSLYWRFSSYLNGLAYPLLGINILPRYDEISLKYRRVQLVTQVQRGFVFQWGDEMILRERSYSVSDDTRQRVLINRYSITAGGYDELSILGVSIDMLGSNQSRGWSSKECSESWLNDNVCDIFCVNDEKDCEKVLYLGGEGSRVNREGVGHKRMLPAVLESPTMHVECSNLGGRSCWRNSKCIKSRVGHGSSGSLSNSESRGTLSKQGEEDAKIWNSESSSYCICDEGFKHQVVKVIDSKSGSIFFRHSCEDIDECEEQSRQFNIEENEQRQGDIYMGYNTNHAIYPSIERTREIAGILTSPFSSLKRHVITPSGLRRPCHPLALCINKQGGYDCICRPGYYGDGKKACVQENMCLSEFTGVGMAQNSLLFMLGSSFGSESELAKREGVGVGELSNEVTELQNVSGGGGFSCPVGLQCIVDGFGNVLSDRGDLEERESSYPTDGDFGSDYKRYCGCKQGYQIASTGDLRCVDVDECMGRMGGEMLNGCGDDSLCTNTVGSYICSCPVGWSGNGYVCIPKGERRDIALKVELSGFFERIVPMGYENFVNSFRMSVIQVLGVNEESVDVVDIGVDSVLGSIRVVIHFKGEMTLEESKDEDNEHLNLRKLDEFVNLLKNTTSDWYKRTYMGMSFGDMVNPGRIEMVRVETREWKEGRMKVSQLVSGFLPDKAYIFISSSPFGQIIVILVLITALVWLILGLVMTVFLFQIWNERGEKARH